MIYDGHASHVSLDIMKWAIEHNIILFVLPLHAPHALQPLDVGCFAPFKACYYSECNLFMAKQRGKIITRYDIASISISPINNNVVPEELFLPSKSFPKKRNFEAEESFPTMKELLSQKMLDTAPNVTSPKKKPRLGGKCITSELVVQVEEYELSRKKPLQLK